MPNFPRFGHAERLLVQETWILDGPHWKLPLWVKPPKEGESESELRLGAGLHLLTIQRKTAGALLDQIARRVGTRWFIHREMLSTVARRTTRTPEECVVWNPSTERPEQYGKLRFGRPDADEFCRTFFRMNQCLRIQDITEVVYLWNAFCKHMFNWLLNMQKPVDLVFAILHPCPYRVDWKEQMKGNLLEPCLLESAEDDTIHWGIEVEPTEVWNKHVAKLEAQRKKDKATRYWHSVVDMLKRRSSDMIRLYERYSAKKVIPYPSFHIVGDQKRKRPLSIRPLPAKGNGGSGLPVSDLHRNGDASSTPVVEKAN